MVYGTMNNQELEIRVLKVIDACGQLVPTQRLDGTRSIANHGEPGIALENLTTQLQESNAHVGEELVIEIETLAKAMHLKDGAWQQLRRTT
jgi:hypothetical protein